jgi:hypothetical protein
MPCFEHAVRVHGVLGCLMCHGPAYLGDHGLELGCWDLSVYHTAPKERNDIAFQLMITSPSLIFLNW